MANFFIDRPIFAWVIAILTMLAGIIGMRALPISQYPEIAPPTIQVSAVYPGASAQTLQNTVTQIIEQNMTGLDGLRYMSSTSDGSGAVSISLVFEQGTNADIAQVQVQNKLQLATPLLPQEVQQQGINVSKGSSSFLMVVGFISNDGSLNAYDLGDFSTSQIREPLSRVEGVGTVTVFGSQYAMRIWLNPDKMQSYGVNVGDIRSAITTQNVQVSAGQIGGSPSVPGQVLNATINAQSRLETVKDFENILVRVNNDGSQVRLRDIARVQLGGENYNVISRYNGKPATGMAISLAEGANALATANAVKARLAELEPNFPPSVEVVYPYDTSPFVKVSIDNVVQTLIEAFILVFAVMYLFLQNWRATIIPTIAVPVVLLGTLAVLAVAGFSINTLTMFGMVLAIGLLVDDAIVVVENVERLIVEEKLDVKTATKKSMAQISSALIGISIVVSAVFLPMAFMSGSTGQIYRQFSITMASAMILSLFVALILTPALCVSLLKPAREGHQETRRFFIWFNSKLNHSTESYGRGVKGFLQRRKRFFLMYLGLVCVLGFLFVRIPASFLPDEDQGILFTLVSLPPNASIERTDHLVKDIEKHFLVDEKRDVKSIFTVSGFSFSGNGQNVGIAFISLKDWSERTNKDASVFALAQRAMMKFSQFKEGMAFPLSPPAILALGTATGFDFVLKDNGNQGHQALMNARNMLLGAASQDPRLVGVRPNGMEDTPQYQIDIDREKASVLGLALPDVNSTLSAAWGGSYINDFIDRGRVKKVMIQADAPYRMNPEDLDRWYVRNNQNQMVPFSAFASSHWTYGSPRLERYNGVPSVQVAGQAAPGLSSGDAMQAMEEIAAELPPGFGFEWTGLSYEEKLAGNQATMLYAISLLVVFLCLAALYESWAIPLAIILIVPLGAFGALLAASFFGLSNDVYFKVGLLTTAGLCAKNAILIVEFAKELHEDGMAIADAAIMAAKQRLRPILMTSISFILGVMPLALRSGAGSGAQNAIGIGIIGGMLGATFLAIYYVPLFYVAIGQWADRFKKNTHTQPATTAE